MQTSATLRTLDRIKAKCRAIHVARRQLDLDDATYRAALKRAAGVNAVLDALAKMGFKHKKTAGAPARLEREPYLQKIEALLSDMQLPWNYAEKIAENITGGKKPESIKRLTWVKQQKHLVGIIAALHGEKKKRLDKVLADLGAALALRGLTPQWAKDQAEAMGRLGQPWVWFECLETIRLITARLPKVA